MSLRRAMMLTSVAAAPMIAASVLLHRGRDDVVVVANSVAKASYVIVA